MRSSKENEFYGNYKRQYTKVLQTPEQGKDLNGVNYLSSYHSSSIERYTQVHAGFCSFFHLINCRLLFNVLSICRCMHVLCWCVDNLVFFFFLFSYHNCMSHEKIIQNYEINNDLNMGPSYMNKERKLCCV